jgi:hypothetical protein
VNLDDIVVLAEIRQVLARYCRGIDRADADLLRTVYHPGATDHHGPVQGSAEHFIDQFIARVHSERAAGDHRCAMHHITNVLLLSRTDETAMVESYFVAFNPTDPEGERALTWSGGRYLDVFRLIDGAWKISERTVLLDFNRANITGETSPRLDSGYPQGQRGTDDLSYPFISQMDPRQPASP